MKKYFIVFIILSSCVTSDKESSNAKSYINNLTPYQIEIKFYKKDSINYYFTLNINANNKTLISSNSERGKGGSYSYYRNIETDDSVVFQFNTDTFLTHYNRQIDTTNKNGYGITNPNNILNPSSFKLSKIKETKRVAYYEYVYEITNQDFLNARK